MSGHRSYEKLVPLHRMAGVAGAWGLWSVSAHGTLHPTLCSVGELKLLDTNSSLLFLQVCATRACLKDSSKLVLSSAQSNISAALPGAHDSPLLFADSSTRGCRNLDCTSRFMNRRPCLMAATLGNLIPTHNGHGELR